MYMLLTEQTRDRQDGGVADPLRDNAGEQRPSATTTAPAPARPMSATASTTLVGLCTAENVITETRNAEMLPIALPACVKDRARKAIPRRMGRQDGRQADSTSTSRHRVRDRADRHRDDRHAHPGLTLGDLPDLHRTNRDINHQHGTSPPR
jgi:hypothetical protein